MSGGGKGGSSTTSVQIPPWLESAAQQNIARANRVSEIGYTPYYGPDVAAFTPMQEAAMQGTNQAALSFGMAAPTSAMAGIPAAETFAGGVRGYSSAPLYEQSLDELRTNAPGQFKAISQLFIDPITGAAPAFSFGTTIPFDPMRRDGGGGGGGGGGGRGVRNPQGGAPEERRNEAAMARLLGGGGEERRQAKTTSINTPMSYAPGGINTRDPNSIVNRLAAAISPKQSTPTSKDRPVARPESAAKAATTKTTPAKTTAKAPAPRGGNRGRI